MPRWTLPLLALAGCATTPPVPPPPDDGLPLKALAQQSLPQSGCALFLWTGTPTRKLVLMATSAPPAAKIVLASGEATLARTGGEGPEALGFTPAATYSDGAVTVMLDLAIEQRADLKDGAAVPSGSLRFDMPAGDSLVLPVTGLIGCR